MKKPALFGDPCILKQKNMKMKACLASGDLVQSQGSLVGL